MSNAQENQDITQEEDNSSSLCECSRNSVILQRINDLSSIVTNLAFLVRNTVPSTLQQIYCSLAETALQTTSSPPLAANPLPPCEATTLEPPPVLLHPGGYKYIAIKNLSKKTNEKELVSGNVGFKPLFCATEVKSIVQKYSSDSTLLQLKNTISWETLY
eukprot:snap_masked-scaffold_27-processed-gene-4.28-mRNA-1 protein AED:1.00 eAED:1.00 QI:0/-1/0/0/-1/1/1/0/159